MIEVTPDVNFWLDACRYDDTLAGAHQRNDVHMQVMNLIRTVGVRAGVRLHTGEHVLRNVREALRKDETSKRGVTRFAWNDADIEDFIALITSAVEATGGKADVRTVSHSQALCEYTQSGAPDAEDHQVIMLAVNAGATVLATNDNGLLTVGEYQGVEIWQSTELVAEVAANVRRLQAEAMDRAKK